MCACSCVSMCFCVYLRVFVCPFMSVYVCLCVHVCVHECLDVFTCSCVCVCIYSCVFMSVCACPGTPVCVQYLHTHCAHVYGIYLCAHAHTHTRTLPPATCRYLCPLLYPPGPAAPAVKIAPALSEIPIKILPRLPQRSSASFQRPPPVPPSSPETPQSLHHPQRPPSLPSFPTPCRDPHSSHHPHTRLSETRSPWKRQSDINSDLQRIQK